MRKLRALVIDDLIDQAQKIAKDLQSVGFDAEVAVGGAAGLERFVNDPADVVVTDLRMRPVDGFDVLDGVKRAEPSVPVIVMSAVATVEVAVEAMRRGAFHFLSRPFDMQALRSQVERACRER